MDTLEKILSRPVAKPYRSGKLGEHGEKPYLNDDGHIDFAPDDIENPKNWSAKRRWYIAVVSISLVLNATYASSSPSGCLEGIAEEFGVSLIASGLVITLFLLGYCFGPLFFAPLSEFYGRRWIFYSTFVGYITFNFLCAWAPNFGALLVGRFLSGTMASAALSNTPGVFADIFGIVERGNAMAVFSMITFAGPGTSPMISGFLQLTKDWRWSFYVLLWLGGISLVFLVTIPETHPATVLTNKARRIRRLKIPGYENVQSPSEASGQKLGQIYKIALTRPWIILFDPISFLIALYISVTYTLLYMLFSIYPIVFKEMRGWNSGLSETPLIGTVIGAALGSLIVFISSKKTVKRIEAGEEIKPEDRLPIAMIGGIGFTVTMFWFGWTANFNSIPWIVPTLAGVFLSTSIVLIFVAYLNYLVDAYLMYAASAIAANTVARSAAGASAPLFTNQMFAALGVGGGASLVGGVAALLAIVPFVFYKYGEGIRRRSRFAPTPSKDDEESSSSPPPGAGEADDSSHHERNEHTAEESDDSDSTVTEEEGATDDATEKNDEMDIPQNAFGQPRTQNTNFGKQDD